MIYAVGDIHGNLAELDRALRLIEQDGADAPVVFLGDYVDRGADSAGVLQRLIDGIKAGRPWICLRGNHDRMFLDYLDDGTTMHPQVRSGRSWLHDNLGGRATLASYGVDVTAKPRKMREDAQLRVPKSHRKFLRKMPLSYQVGGMIFVHAGIRPGVRMADQVEEDLIWIREPFLSDPRDHGALVVHGHTVQERPVHCGNRVNLDGGAGYGRPLVPAVFEGGECLILTERGRWPLRP